ncbi:putative bifunctional diguanylate cyclase/phosphodiesterase [Butyrivibrio sp. JL13D10]|uniref:putative bifunctional diguanylate cyclase/phosphodiesterase n=1 Tax=Butyrivibrio sp. JL13D10 TaxID=3236815 RepID=UPI0038B54D5A
MSMSMTKKIFILAAGLFYLLTAVFTILDNKIGLEFCAPVTTTLVIIILVSELKYLGPHKFSTACMALGFMAIDVYYIFRFIDHHVISLAPYSKIIETIYITPSLFFAINETTFLIYKLKDKKRDMAHLLSNSFVVSIIGFMFLHKILTSTGISNHRLEEAIYHTLFFAAFYVIMMSFQTFYLIGPENIRKGTLLTTMAMFTYEIMDIQYIFAKTIGGSPDDYYLDLIYMALIIIMTMGIVIQVHRKYYFEFRSWSYDSKSTRMRFLLALICTIVATIMFVTGYMTGTEVTYTVIVIMAYMIMTYIQRSDSLVDELLEHEKRQNALLEEKVQEQTKDLVETNKKLELLSSTDMLTGLYNRWYAGKYMAELQEKTHESGRRYAFFVIDLNNFKPVNDTYGHEMGDKVLEEFGNRMRELPDEYVSFRIGGDEFLIIKRLQEDTHYLDSAAEKIRKLFITPVKYDDYVFNLSASIGISVYPQDSSVMEELLQYADAAMYYVKNSGNKDGYKFFNSNLIQIISMRAAIEKRLRIAKPERDFVLYYQPQINVETGKIVGAEVFVHFKGELEEVSPKEIISAAEESGIMGELGVWIIKTAVRQMAEWNVKYQKTISITINMSPLQLINTDFEIALSKVTKEQDFLPSMVTLDVTNAVIMGASSSAKNAMIKLHEEGYLLSLNDFGGGDINLSFVQDCGFNGIKLSKSLISKSVNDTGTKILVKSILSFAENLGIAVTAVGIENEEEAENMKNMGVTELQGYYYGKPVRAEEFEKILG